MEPEQLQAVNRISRSSAIVDAMCTAFRSLSLLPYLIAQIQQVLRQEEHLHVFLLRLFFIVFLLFDIGLMFYRTVMIHRGRMSFQCKADGGVVNMLMLPCISLLNFTLVPNFLNGKNWMSYAACTTLGCSVYLELPPSHMFLAWIYQCSVFTFLDFIVHQQAGTCLSTAGLLWAIAKHLSTRGLMLFGGGLVNSLVPVLISTKQRKDVARYVNSDADLNLIIFQPPFKSFGLDLQKTAPWLSYLFSQVDTFASDLSDKIDDTQLAVYFYGSLIILSIASIHWNRTNEKMAPIISNEGQLFSYLVANMLGRQMSRLDVLPALDYIRNKLGQDVARANEVMIDLLPNFVVEDLMSGRLPMINLKPTVILKSAFGADEALQELTESVDRPTDPFVICENAELHFTLGDGDRRLSGGRALSSKFSGSQRSIRSKMGVTCSTSTVTGARARHDSVTVFFSDLVGFSTWSHNCDPDEVMDTLDELFSRLDTIIMEEMPGLYKLETVGDAYIVAANLVEKDESHALTAVRFALRAQYEASQVFQPGTTIPLQMRIGLHTGPVSSGIVGKMRKRYCCFGDTMNMGARTESSCPPGRVQLTEATYRLLISQAGEADREDVSFVDRGLVEVKGSDQPLHMFLAFAVL